MSGLFPMIAQSVQNRNQGNVTGDHEMTEAKSGGKH